MEIYIVMSQVYFEEDSTRVEAVFDEENEAIKFSRTYDKDEYGVWIETRILNQYKP